MIFARNCSSRRSWSKIGRHDVNHGHPCEDFVLPNHSTFNPFEHYSDRLLGSWQIEILGTDLSHQILARARAGRYAQIEINRGLPAAYLVKHFKRHGLEWEVSDAVRRMVRFEQLDLRQIPRLMGPFDLALCRNVLIYFDLDTKRKIVQSIRTTMAPGGILVLGSAETLLNLDAGLERKVAGAAGYYQTP